MKKIASACVAVLALANLVRAGVSLEEKDGRVTLANELVSLVFDVNRATYSVTDMATHETVLADATVQTGCDESQVRINPKIRQEDVSDELGTGKRFVVELKTDERPAGIFSFSLYEGQGILVLGFGLNAPVWFSERLMKASPLCQATVYPGKKMERPQTLDGTAGAHHAQVEGGMNRAAENSLMLTGLVDGKRRTVVWGGLKYRDFGKYAALRNGVLELSARDPVGRLVDAGETYMAGDTFYLDVTTADPFLALERYGRAMRKANDAHPNVYDFPVLCGWGVGNLSHLGDVNTSVKLVAELEMAQKCGFTKYTKVAVRLEPDNDEEQGWWDDAHWSRCGHLVPPYDTIAKWCAALRERDGIPYTYFKVGIPASEFAKAHPEYMLFNDNSRFGLKHASHQPYVSYDYTDPGFQKHMQAVWTRMRQDGVCGIKFDYPESGWRPEGGFEDKHATTAAAYRKAFQLARDGLGTGAFLDERNIGENGRPCLDVTAGIVDTQRTWGDSSAFVPGMVKIDGLRWYKNRTVFNYYPDSKAVHGTSSELRQSMLTMIYLTSGRIDLVTSFRLFTPEITHDFSRIYPAYREPFTARPLDAFCGNGNPQVYDLELTPDWHQVALYNTTDKTGVVSVALSGDRTTNAIGLDPAASYYAYDFWADAFLGKLPGTARIEKSLPPNCSAMISVRKAQDHPQVISTSRHLLQGWLDLADVKWDAAGRRFSGVAKVIGGEPFRIVIAHNGHQAGKVMADQAEAKLESHPAEGLAVIVLKRPTNGDVKWQVEYR